MTATERLRQEPWAFLRWTGPWFLQPATWARRPRMVWFRRYLDANGTPGCYVGPEAE